MYWNPCSCSGWQRTQSQPSVSSFLASRFNFYLSGFNSEKHLTPGMFTTIFPPHGPWLSMLAVLQVASAMFPWYLASFLQVHDLECTFDIAGLVLHLLNICCIESWTFCGSQVLKKIQLPVSVVQRFSNPSSSSYGSNARIALHPQAPQPCSVPSARMGPLDDGVTFATV